MKVRGGGTPRAIRKGKSSGGSESGGGSGSNGGGGEYNSKRSRPSLLERFAAKQRVPEKGELDCWRWGIELICYYQLGAEVQGREGDMRKMKLTDRC